MVKDFVDLTDLKKLNNPDVVPLKFRLIYNTLFYSGMRPGELLHRTPDDFHKEYDEAKDKYYYFFDLKTQKNGTKDELTPIRQIDYAGMQDYIKINHIKDNEYIFKSTRKKSNKPMSVSWLDRVLAQHLEKLGINKKITAHSFRAGLVTKLREDGLSYAEISTITRHQNLTIMQKHYDKRIKFNAYNIIDNL